MKQIRTFWDKNDEIINQWIKDNGVNVIDIKVQVTEEETGVFVIYEVEGN